METLAERDYFSDHSILKDPYEYFEAIRAKGPVYALPGRDIVVVTGFEESLEVLKNIEDFSSVIAPQGPAVPLPFAVEGDTITPQIEAHRTSFVGGDLLVAYDDIQHNFSRSILNRLFTPSRLKANEAGIAAYADQLVKACVANGRCELMKDIATPFVTIVIAELLGVPADDRQTFMEAIEAGPPPGSLDSDDLLAQNQPLVLMGTYFVQYVHDRRENPRSDVLSELANATYPDGSTPDALEIVRLGTFLFGAGQDTSAKLLGNAMRFITEQPDLQQRLRADTALIPAFLEEVLRLEGSTKMTARLARKNSSIAGIPVPVGTKVMVALSAANRDPRRWEKPQDFLLDRPKIKEHLAFGRGAHVCAGAPLARVEVRVILEKLFEHTSHIDLSEASHGQRGQRKLDYDSSFIIRGLSRLDLVLTPAPGFVAPPPIAAKQDAKPSWLRRLFGFGRPQTAAAPDGPYSTATTKIGILLADPAAIAILDAHFPGMSQDPKIGMAKAMTLRMIQKFSADLFSDEALDAVDAAFAKLGRK